MSQVKNPFQSVVFVVLLLLICVRNCVSGRAYVCCCGDGCVCSICEEILGFCCPKLLGFEEDLLLLLLASRERECRLG